MSNETTRTVVTGGAGFIGSSLVAQLLGAGHDVVVIDNMTQGSRAKLRDALAESELNGERLTVIEADVRDDAALRSAIEGAATVFHLACLGVRHSLHDPLENHSVNALGTLKTLQVARELSVSRFVHVSSSEVYGTARTVPMTEEHPTFPHTVYGASKLAGEAYARAYRDSFGLQTVVLRPFNAFGPRSHHEGDSGEVIPRFLVRALAGEPPVIFGDGTQTRDFTYVEDTARGIMTVGLHPDAVGRTVNLGSQSEVSIAHLATQILEATGRTDLSPIHDDPRPGDVRRLFASGTLARDAFGFVPKVSLADGLSRLMAYYTRQEVDAAARLEDLPARNWE
jgi:UDP-glucose 4-epimerase